MQMNSAERPNKLETRVCVVNEEEGQDKTAVMTSPFPLLLPSYHRLLLALVFKLFYAVARYPA